MGTHDKQRIYRNGKRGTFSNERSKIAPSWYTTGTYRGIAVAAGVGAPGSTPDDANRYEPVPNPALTEPILVGLTWI